MACWLKQALLRGCLRSVEHKVEHEIEVALFWSRKKLLQEWQIAAKVFMAPYWEVVNDLRDLWAKFRKWFMAERSKMVKSLIISASTSAGGFGLISLFVYLNFYWLPAWATDIPASLLMWPLSYLLVRKYVWCDRQTPHIEGGTKYVVKSGIFAGINKLSFIFLVATGAMPFWEVILLRWAILGPISYLINNVWVFPIVLEKLEKKA